MAMWLIHGQTFWTVLGLGLEVMHERFAHNFPLDLAAAETTVALDCTLLVIQSAAKLCMALFGGFLLASETHLMNTPLSDP